MNESLSAWALSVCGICAAGALLSFLFPQSASRKLLRMILSMTLLCAVVRPLQLTGEWISYLTRPRTEVVLCENPALEDAVNQNAGRIFAAYWEKNLRDLLDGRGFSYEKLNVKMDIHSDGSISLGQVEVVVKEEKASETERIRTFLSDVTGTEPVIRIQDAS